MGLFLQRSALHTHNALICQALQTHPFQAVIAQADQPGLQQSWPRQ